VSDLPSASPSGADVKSALHAEVVGVNGQMEAIYILNSGISHSELLVWHPDTPCPSSPSLSMMQERTSGLAIDGVGRDLWTSCNIS